MKEITKWISRLNTQQKLIVAITFPVILFFITLKIAGIVGQTTYFFKIEHPFAFEDTWWVWLLFALIVAFFEYKLFEKIEK